MNAEAPTVINDGENVTDRRFVQVPFAPNWSVIVVIVLFDISNEPDRFVQPEKAADPNTVRDIGENVRIPVPLQPLNADPCICVIEEGKVATSLLHPENACCPTVVRLLVG